MKMCVCVYVRVLVRDLNRIYGLSSLCIYLLDQNFKENI
jgi:hypothetical protein